MGFIVSNMKWVEGGSSMSVLSNFARRIVQWNFCSAAYKSFVTLNVILS